MEQTLNKFTTNQHKILLTSLDILHKNNEFFVIRFYHYILQTKANKLFKHTDMEQQSKMFITSLNLIVNQLGDSSFIDTYMPKIVEKHTEYGNMIEYLDDFKNSFINALQEVFIDKQDNYILNTWVLVVDKLLSYFK